MTVQNGTVLYHGSYVPVESVDLSLCADGKDFGKGFYLTSNENQARRFIRTSLKKAQGLGLASKDQNFGFVSVFRLGSSCSALNMYEFETVNEQWLWFVSLNRRSAMSASLRSKVDPRLFDADVVVGRVANDTTNPVITTYLNGLYGPVEDPRSVQTAIDLLLPHKLKDQYCFLTQRAVDCLEFVKGDRYEL